MGVGVHTKMSEVNTVFLSYSPHYFLRQCFSVDMGFSSSAQVAGQQVPGIHLYFFASARLVGACHHSWLLYEY